MEDNQSFPPELRERIIALVREHPDYFRDAGESLDAEYGNKALRSGESRKKRYLHKQGRAKRHKDTTFATNATMRKMYPHSWESEKRTQLVMDAEGKFHPLPRYCKYERFALAWGDTLGTGLTPNARGGLKATPAGSARTTRPTGDGQACAAADVVAGRSQRAHDTSAAD